MEWPQVGARTGDKTGGIAEKGWEGEGSRDGEGVAAAAATAVAALKNLTTPWEGNLFIGGLHRCSK